MPVSSSTEHWIKPDALTINLNHFGDPDYLQVSVLAGAVVMAFKQDVIGYNAAHNYRTWPLDAANTYLETSSAVNVYAKLTRSEVNARALVVYDTILRDIEGREITYAEDGSEVLGEANSEYFFVFLGQISASVNSNGEFVQREWNKDITTGNLDTNQQRNDTTGSLDLMFRPHYDNPLDPNEITWIEALTHLGIAGGITMYVNGGKLNIPSIYAGLPIDGKTIYWDNGILKAKGGTEGAITSVTKDMVISALGYTPYNASNPSGYITSSALTGYATQSWVEGKGYALASDLDSISAKLNNFLEGSDTDTIINKWLELETFLSGLSESDNLATILAGKIDKTYVDSNFVTINTTQSILGEKNFTGGLKVNGAPIVYNSEKGYWKLEGDLLVTGGVSFYSSDMEYVPSTIMSALLLDDSTLGINSDGQLYVKGNLSGGASTLGELSNVGTWANSVADVDRIMYQAAGSSMWVAKSLSSIGGGGGVSGDYLPLSGGTISSSSFGPLSIMRLGSNYSGAIKFYNETDGYLGALGIGGSYSNFVPEFEDKNGNTNTLLHSGNYSNYALPTNHQNVNPNTENGNWLGMTNINTPVADIYYHILSSNHFKGTSNSNGYWGAQLALPTQQLTSNNMYYRKALDSSTNWQKWIKILDENNYSSYALPLSGGTLTVASYENFVIKRDADSAFSGLTLANRDEGVLGYIGIGGQHSDYPHQPCFVLPDKTTYKIWHSGNDGSGSGLDADLLDGKQPSALNVGSATKLQTARTIWGQSFDGTGNVDGIIKMTSADQINGTLGLSLNYDCGTKVGTNIWNGQGGITIRCTPSGNVGIGTASPIETLHVEGTGRIDKIHFKKTFINLNRNGNNGAIYDSTKTALELEAMVDLSVIRTYNVDAQAEISLHKNGCVGIGTIYPQTKLHVNGNLMITGRESSNISTVYNSNGSITTNSPTIISAIIHALQFKWYDTYWQIGNIRGGSSDSEGFGVTYGNNNLRFRVTTNEVVCYNNLRATGGITMYSDQRKKTILNNVELSLSQIANAPLVEHFYNSDDKRTTHVGSIAQYWANINDWFCKLDNEGYYTMEIQNCALASAISIARELSRYESKTDKTIKQLKKRICQLEEELERLKSA